MNKKQVTKAFVYEIFPTPEQKTQINKTIGCARFVYNRALAEYTAAYEIEKAKPKEEQRPFSAVFGEVCKTFSPLAQTEDYGWLKEVYAQCWHNAYADLQDAFKRFFKGLNRYPKFKRRSFSGSCTVNVGTSKNGNFAYAGDHIRVPAKLGAILKIGKGKPINGKAKRLTINKTATGRYFVSIMCENSEIDVFPAAEKEIGLDTGVINLVTYDDGQMKAGKTPFEIALKKIKYLQRQLSKKDELYKKECKRLKAVMGENYVKPERSKAREKLRIELAKAHEHAAFIRETYLHTLSTKIVRENGFIAVEDLDVKGLFQNKLISRKLGDHALGEFYRQLEYKSGWHGRIYHKIDRFYPSSKVCSECGWLFAEWTLKHRIWTCKECGTQHNCDINAAKNILAQAKKECAEGKEVKKIIKIKNKKLKTA